VLIIGTDRDYHAATPATLSLLVLSDTQVPVAARYCFRSGPVRPGHALCRARAAQYRADLLQKVVEGLIVRLVFDHDGVCSTIVCFDERSVIVRQVEAFSVSVEKEQWQLHLGQWSEPPERNGADSDDVGAADAYEGTSMLAR